MGIQNSIISSNIATQGNQQTTPLNKNGIVYSVILDETHPRVKNSNTQYTTELIGAIEFRYTGGTADGDNELPIAYPFDKNNKNLPVRNEAVEIIINGSGQPHYRRIGLESSPNVNTDPEYIKKNYSPRASSGIESKNDSYREVANTGQAKSGQQNSTKYDGFGNYFTAQTGIHKLKLYEGDYVIESRFGQSIRFSAYNNDKNEFSPTVIIRNNENSTSRSNTVKQSTLEDINKDGSIIALTSDKYQMGFVPGTINDKGTSDFQKKPDSFAAYPDKLTGDQILINSGRIILSAKNAEMIFYSKKNYGFISDGALSIDNALGIEANVGADINVTTNDRNINFNTTNGKINLGNTQLEPLVKGNKLVDLLTELIDAIVKQQYLTPSGPSKIGPENLPTFNNIKSKLKTILSELNSTS